MTRDDAAGLGPDADARRGRATPRRRRRRPRWTCVFTFDTIRGVRVTKRFVLPTTPNALRLRRGDLRRDDSPGGRGGQEIYAAPPRRRGRAREPQDFTTGLPPDESLVYFVSRPWASPSAALWKIDPVKIEEPGYSERVFRHVGVRTQYFAARALGGRRREGDWPR